MTGSGTVVSGSRDTTLRVWNVSPSSDPYVLEGHKAAVRCVVAQGSRIVSAGYDNLVKFWRLGSSECEYTSDASAEKIYSLALLKGGDVAVSGSLDGSIHLYDIVSLSVLGKIGYDAVTATQHRGLITNIKEGKDDTFVASDNKGNIQVYDIKNSPCERKRSFIAHPDSSVSSLIVFNSGHIFTSGSDGKVRLWDLTTNAEEKMTPVAEMGEPARMVWRVVSVGARVIIALFRGNGIIIEFWDLDIPGHHPEEVKTRKYASVTLVDAVSGPW
ncbi:hypothetical protein MMC30_001135 [Trapelia coarctata]|nr:hypothetical protein [Trapelia coarctata]